MVYLLNLRAVTLGFKNIWLTICIDFKKTNIYKLCYTFTFHLRTGNASKIFHWQGYSPNKPH